MTPDEVRNLGEELKAALHNFLLCFDVGDEVLENTPGRVLEMYKEMFAGSGFTQPVIEHLLGTGFDSNEYKEMVVITDIPLVSMCEHHLLPFIGRAHFGYIPNGRVIGLSKIPRLIQSLARKPQIQERLTKEITEAFNKYVTPVGCGLVIEAEHTCMTIRGVRAHEAKTKTTSLVGAFFKQQVREEFLSNVRR